MFQLKHKMLDEETGKKYNIVLAGLNELESDVESQYSIIIVSSILRINYVYIVIE